MNKDLKNLRTQIYSAAEYLELGYTSDDQKQIVVETLKDRAIKALVNTVDHLGSVACKVNDLLDAKVDEVSDAEHRISCMNRFNSWWWMQSRIKCHFDAIKNCQSIQQSPYFLSKFS
ncbi:hypothetical protein WN944_014725 [Citrus x changshan-huyou]|uniref:Uncharacterized protein n=1 Tax=Citrus x changshan-huyou TaxID=2935761 RepID=A0AAP0QLU1_9ROSI